MDPEKKIINKNIKYNLKIIEKDFGVYIDKNTIEQYKQSKKRKP